MGDKSYKPMEDILKCAERCEAVSHEVLSDLKHKNIEFMDDMKKEASDFYAGLTEKFEEHLKGIKEDRKDERSNESRFTYFMWGVMLSIVGFVSVNVQDKVSRDEIRDMATKSETMTKKEVRALTDLRDAYYNEHFVHKDPSEVDSTNYNLLVKGIFGGVLRGGSAENTLKPK